MKRILYCLAILATVVGCGKTGVPGSGPTLIGGVFDVTGENANAQLTSQISSICQALSDKDAYFRANHLSPGTKFNFKTSVETCEDQTLKSAAQVRLAVSGGQLQYELITGDYFISKLETSTDGVISPLCANLSDLKLPQPVGSQLALRYRVDVCDADMLCLYVESGVKQTSGRFVVTRADRFNVSMAGSLPGMVLEHERQLGDVCDAGQVQTNIATFQDLN